MSMDLPPRPAAADAVEAAEAGAPSSRPWRALLAPPQRAAALDAVRAIAGVAADATRAFAERHPDPRGVSAHSLACGRSGAALFYAYCAAAEVVPGADAVAVELLDEAIDLLSRSEPDASLFCGFAGVAWTAEHLERMAAGADGDGADDGDGAADAGGRAGAAGGRAGEAGGRAGEAGARVGDETDGAGDADDDGDLNAAIDDALLNFLDGPQAEAEYDVVDGLCGIGVYALERLPRAGGAECLARVVARLDSMARREPGAVCWPTPEARLARHGIAPGSQGEFNLGLAHGVPGPIALLAHALWAGVASDAARALVSGAVPWLLAQRLPDGQRSRFPAYAGPGADATPARCAWCYGDPGVAVALLAAARCVGRVDWQHEALAVARHAAAVRTQRDDVRDAGLCHGAGGVGHIFNRMFQATGDEVCRAAAEYWFERVLAFRGDGGLAGFRTWSLERTLDGEWMDDPRFLTGVTGTGLALLAAATEVAPAWDIVMLTRVPGGAGGEG